MLIELDTVAVFKTHVKCWFFMGLTPPKRYRTLYLLYSFVINTMVTILFPLHLVIGFFFSSSLRAITNNLSISLTCAVCSMKTFVMWWNMKEINGIFDIIRQQDERITWPDGREYMRSKVHPDVMRILRSFVVICFLVSATSEAAVLYNGIFDGTWRLHYEAAFYPFDPLASSGIFAIVHIYQFVAISHSVLQNLVNDTFAAMHIVLLAGQVHILSLRLASLGHDPSKTKEQNNEELLECIKHYLNILSYRSKLQDVISIYMFFQILLAGINMCVVLVFILLFVDDIFTLSYYFIYMIGLIAEILPSCYYGTVLEEELLGICYALYSSNWTEQDEKFKQNVKIVIEQSWRRMYLDAWLFRININSFTIACKNAYSMFALIMNMD